jgi:hypothetical protein
MMIDLNDPGEVQRLLRVLQQSGSAAGDISETPDTGHTAKRPDEAPAGAGQDARGVQDGPRRRDLPFIEVNIGEAKANLSRYIRTLEQKRARALVIKRNGERVAVMVCHPVPP